MTSSRRARAHETLAHKDPIYGALILTSSASMTNSGVNVCPESWVLESRHQPSSPRFTDTFLTPITDRTEYAPARMLRHVKPDRNPRRNQGLRARKQ